MYIITFIGGLVIGILCGVFSVALAAASSLADKEMEKIKNGGGASCK